MTVMTAGSALPQNRFDMMARIPDKRVKPTGLTKTEVAIRLQQHGYNELPSSKSRSIFATAWEWSESRCFCCCWRVA